MMILHDKGASKSGEELHLPSGEHADPNIQVSPRQVYAQWDRPKAERHRTRVYFSDDVRHKSVDPRTVVVSLNRGPEREHQPINLHGEGRNVACLELSILPVGSVSDAGPTSLCKSMNRSRLRHLHLVGVIRDTIQVQMQLTRA